jgi:DNA-binding CsgD family transcriptional regulator
MTVGHSTRYAAPASNIIAFAQPARRPDARYDLALASKETELRESLAKIQALRRQYDEIMQPEGDVLDAPFTVDDAAVCRLAGLTSRQHEIMDLVLAGRSSKIIAWELGISQRTVENHRAAIMKKTASKSIPALAQFAIAAAIPFDARIEMGYDRDKDTQPQRTPACTRN